MIRTGTSRTIEGGLCALLAGIAGMYIGYIAFRLSQLVTDWLISAVSHQPRALEGIPASFVLVPPPHTWNVAAIVGAIIGVAAYWIHTSTSDAHIRAKRRRWFSIIIVVSGVLIGRGVDFIADWGILLMALHDIVWLVVALWVTWTLISFADNLIRRHIR